MEENPMLYSQIRIITSNLFNYIKNDFKKLSEKVLSFYNIDVNNENYDSELKKFEIWAIDKISNNLYCYFEHSFPEIQAYNLSFELRKDRKGNKVILVLHYRNSDRAIAYIDLNDYTLNNWKLSNLLFNKYGEKKQL